MSVDRAWKCFSFCGLLTAFTPPAAAINISLSEFVVDLGELPAFTPPGAPVSVPAPTVKLTASDAFVAPGQSLTLRWSSTNARTCTTGGGWQGTRGVSGAIVVGPINQRTTFSLQCSGTGGAAVTMIAVGVIRSLPLTWVPPTQNVDGSTLTDLTGFRIYWGSASRSYSGQMMVSNPAQTSQLVSLRSGTYFFAMTAIDRDGNESALSNEVVKIFP